MSVATLEDLEKLGQSIVANSVGAVTSAHVAYGELTLHAEAHRIVDASGHTGKIVLRTR